MISSAALWSALRASLPADVVDRYEAEGAAGLEYVAAIASAGQRASGAIDDGAALAFLLAAPAGAHATGTVTISISYVALFDLRLRAGAVVRTLDGRGYVTTEDAVFPAPLFGAQTVAARSERQGSSLNLPDAGQIAEFVRGSWVRDDTGAVAPAPLTTPTVSASTAFTGGAFPLLELLAPGHGAEPAAGEAVETIRERAWAPPLAVTKPQLEELATRILWASVPSATPPFALATIVEPPDVGDSWGGDSAWGDDTADALWTEGPPWFILVMPDATTGLDGAGWADDAAFGDDDAWGDTDAGRDALYWHVFEAVRRAAAAGVVVYGTIGRV